MAIADMIRAESSFGCVKYEAIAGGKRCRHYLDNGACTRGDELMCVEWLRANGHTEAPDLAPAPLVGGTLGRRPPLPTAAHVVSLEREDSAPPPPRGLTSDDIESFKALGAAVCLKTPHLGEVWLVPRYTGRDRRELTLEHVATLYHVLAVFPDAQVVAFDTTPSSDEESPS